MMAISAVTIIGGSGSAAAHASPGSPRPGHFRIMSTKATARRLSIIATGAFTSGGHVVPAVVTDTVVFPGGRFKFRHVSRRVVASFNAGICLANETQRGTFTIGDGTGKYSGIHGSGKFVTSIVAVTAKNRAGRCTHAQAPATFTATGTVSR